MPNPPYDLSLNKTTALVIGGAGAIGSYVCEHLLNLGTQVICIDRLLHEEHENITHLLRDQNFYLINNDLNKNTPIEELTLPVKINYIFNLEPIKKNNLDGVGHFGSAENNLVGLENLLKIALKNNSKCLFSSVLLGFTANTPIEKVGEKNNLGSTWNNHDNHSCENSSESLILNYHRKFQLDVRLVRFGDVYGPRSDIVSGSVLTEVMSQAVFKNTISLPMVEEELVYPVYVSDAVTGVFRAMFVPGSGGEIYKLFNPQGERVGEFIQQVKKIIENEYSKTVTIEHLALVPQRENFIDANINYPSGWEPVVSEAEGIERTVKWLLSKNNFSYTRANNSDSQNPKNIEEKTKTTFAKEESRLTAEIATPLKGENEFIKSDDEQKNKHERLQKNILRLVRVLLITIFISVSIAMLVMSFYLFLCKQNINKIQDYITRGELSLIKDESTRLIKSASSALSITQMLGGPLKYFGLDDKVAVGEKTLYLAKNLGESLVGLVGLAETGSKFSEYILSDQDLEPKETISKIKLHNENSLEKISLTQGILDTFTGQERIIGKKIQELKRIIPEIKYGLLMSRDLLDMVPSLVGIDDQVSYLILFQNNMELRPGGGFIGSYAIANFVDGKMVNLKIDDVYSADGQLKGHVEPPAKLKEFLNVDGWYLRDSNWSVDFPENALKAEWFLDKETGITVDGVISINLNVIQRILRVLGEIYLPDYDEKINADNFFEKAEYRTEAGFFPGSSQKGDYLGNVSRIVMEKIRNSDEQTKGKLILAIFDSITEKDIMIYGHDQNVAKVLAKNNWDGSIKMANCIKGGIGCFQDYLMVNDANVGVNKANYYLKKDVFQEIIISSSGAVEKTVEVNYVNESPNNIFPAGDYKSYTRVLVPLGSQINDCRIFEQGNEVDPPKCEVITDIEGGRTSFGVYVMVPVGEKRKININYSLPKGMVFLGGEYLLFIQKQSGIGMPGDKYSVSLIFPESLSLVWSSQPLLTKKGQIVYNTSLSKDQALEIGLEK